jgi:PAS domain S-box-containing protein
VSTISEEILCGAAANNEHFVRFYEDDTVLMAEVADFIDVSLRAGGSGIVIATPDHVSELRRRLAGFGTASDGNHWSCEKLLTLDAEETLAQFMVNEWPDENLFDAVVGNVVRAACAANGSVNAFGEMVALLCERGLFDAAIRLEQLWNALAANTSFSLYCAYPWKLFPTAELSASFQKVCEAHDHVCGHGKHAISTETKDVHIRLAQMEQKARVLQTEVARRKAAERALKLRERELADFLENSVEGLHRVGADGTILWANKAELNMLGYRWDEYVGHSIIDFHVDRPVIDDILCKLKAGETLYDRPALLRCKDGSVKHVLIHSNACFEDGQLRYTRCFTRDATERYERDRAIAQRDRMLLQAPIAAALLTTPHFTFHIANRRFCEITSRSDIEGKTFADVFPELRGGELEQQMQRVAMTAQPFSAEELPFVIHAADGTSKEYFIQCSLEPLTGIDGDTHSIIFVAADVTQSVRDRQQLQIVHAEREKLVTQLTNANRAKDEFLAMLGHELRNPLSPILLSLQLMRLRGDTASTREQEVIERQVQHMTRLVDDLLDISRITRGRIELDVSDIDMSQVLAKAIEMASPIIEQRCHQLKINVDDGLRMNGDPTRLAQVVSNLLTNAARYTDIGGQIVLSANQDNEGQLRISVKDNGVGISEEMQAQIFELFFQGKQNIDRAHGGLGIGLSIVKNIVELHGGTVKAKSRGAGSGSEFIVTLPALRLAPESAAMVPAQMGVLEEGCKRRVMLVDDNEDAANALGTLLESHGHEVEIFYDPVTALSAAQHFKPEIAVLDIGLPVLNGYELAAKLRSVMGEQPCRLIALTGYGQEADKAKSQIAGFEKHLVKPVCLNQLAGLINSPDLH